MSASVQPQDLQVGQIVMIIATTGLAQGFVGKLFKVLAVDYPYGVLLWLESKVMQSRHTEDLRQFTFIIPSKEYIEAAIPDDVWPEIVDDTSRC
jgi:hypothetical protein